MSQASNDSPETLPQEPMGDGPDFVNAQSIIAPTASNSSLVIDSPFSLLRTAVERGATVDTLERIMALAEKMQAAKAKAEYDTAMAAFQSECPEIAKTKEVHTDSGALAYRYAPIESIVEQVKPLLLKHGFSYATTMELKGDTVRVVCRVKHAGGHFEDSPMEVPLGNKTRIMSDTQVVAAASTYAKRYAFCNSFGIMTGDEDTDARPEPERNPNMQKPTQQKPKSDALKVGALRERVVKVSSFSEVKPGVWRFLTGGDDAFTDNPDVKETIAKHSAEQTSVKLTEIYNGKGWCIQAADEPKDQEWKP